MDAKDEIKNRLGIVDVVSSYVQLKPAGRNFKALCPFHKDTHPSMVISPDRGLAWCFACQSGGDIFAFVQQIENISFPEAMRLLADKANVRLPEFSPEKKEKRDKTIEILEVINKKFQKDFWRNQNAQDTVAERQISEKTLKKYQVGFALKGGNEAEKYLLDKKFSHKEMQDAGITTIWTGGQIKDKFISRIMFPIFSSTGTVVGFSGRIYGEGEPKFLNSPETILFKKSEILHGLNFAKESIRKKDFCLVVEGQFDLLACSDKGIENVVAASGTAFSATHVKQIMRFSKNIVFALDADEAGIRATKRAIEIAIKEGANALVLVLPDGKDPDDCLRTEETKKDFFERLEKRIPAVDFLMQIAFSTNDKSSAQGRQKIIESIFSFIGKLPSQVEQGFYIKSLAEKLDTKEQFLLEEFTKNQNSQKKYDIEIPKKTEIHRPCNQMQYFIGMMIAFKELQEMSNESIVESLFPEGEEKKLFKLIKNKYNDSGFCAQKYLNDSLSQEDAKKWELITLYVEEKSENIPESLKKEEFKKLISQINNANFSALYRDLSQKYKSAEEGAEKKEVYLKMNQLLKLKSKL